MWYFRESAYRLFRAIKKPEPAQKAMSGYSKNKRKE